MAEPVVVGQDVWKTYGSGDTAVNALQGISVEIREEEMVAVMGILALRAVVERRREIGMLRASGFSQRDVLRAFLLEYSYVTLLGLGIGTWLGIWIVYQLSLNPNAAASGVSFFAVPYLNIALIVVAAYGLAMLAIAIPSIRASHLPPAEAVRATEWGGTASTPQPRGRRIGSRSRLRSFRYSRGGNRRKVRFRFPSEDVASKATVHGIRSGLRD